MFVTQTKNKPTNKKKYEVDWCYESYCGDGTGNEECEGGISLYNNAGAPGWTCDGCLESFCGDGEFNDPANLGYAETCEFLYPGDPGVTKALDPNDEAFPFYYCCMLYFFIVFVFRVDHKCKSIASLLRVPN